MSASHVSIYARLSRRVRAPLPPKLAEPEPAHEHEARDHAAMAARRDSDSPMQQSQSGTPAVATASGGEGKLLHSAEREIMEAQFNRDFSHVRLHADEEAAGIAQDFGARALTVGEDIFFAPGEFPSSPNRGVSLLAHELTHAAQQADAAQTALQFQPKKQKAGIGATPPTEPFIVMENETGSEDDFVVFDRDDATLDAGDQKKILDVIGTRKEPLQVFIHGYASSEGPGDYNLNLSAHRAAAVKAFLEGRLPAGSSVTLFAHGKTEAFGKANNNRRAGVSLVQPLVLPGSVGFKHRLGGVGLDLSLGEESSAPCDLNASFRLKLPILGPRCGISPDDLPPLPPAWTAPLPPLLDFGIDWLTLRGIYNSHGVPMSERDARGIAEEWERSSRLLDQFGITDRFKFLFFTKEWILNKGISSQVQDQQARENPNTIDQANKEWKQAHPEAVETPIITIFDIDWFRDKKKKK
jgi:outer membrane protein OmpA-like peptidoglycan-associated protein